MKLEQMKRLECQVACDHVLQTAQAAWSRATLSSFDLEDDYILFSSRC